MDRVGDHLGLLVAYLDGTVLSSTGELENNEQIANLVSNLVTVSKNIPPHDEKFTKITILYPDILYAICLSNAKISITKHRRQPQLPESSVTLSTSIN